MRKYTIHREEFDGEQIWDIHKEFLTSQNTEMKNIIETFFFLLAIDY